MFLEMCKSFELIPKGLSTKKRLCFGKPSEELEKEWKYGIDELDDAVICCCRNIVRNSLILWTYFGVISSM